MLYHSYTVGGTLCHHGVLHQKWGERHGPPYPLDRSISTGKSLKTERKIKKAGEKNAKLSLKRAKLSNRILRIKNKNLKRTGEADSEKTKKLEEKESKLKVKGLNNDAAIKRAMAKLLKKEGSLGNMDTVKKIATEAKVQKILAKIEKQKQKNAKEEERLKNMTDEEREEYEHWNKQNILKKGYYGDATAAFNYAQNKKVNKYWTEFEKGNVLIKKGKDGYDVVSRDNGKKIDHISNDSIVRTNATYEDGYGDRPSKIPENVKKNWLNEFELQRKSVDHELGAGVTRAHVPGDRSDSTSRKEAYDKAYKYEQMKTNGDVNFKSTKNGYDIVDKNGKVIDHVSRDDISNAKSYQYENEHLRPATSKARESLLGIAVEDKRRRSR